MGQAEVNKVRVLSCFCCDLLAELVEGYLARQGVGQAGVHKVRVLSCFCWWVRAGVGSVALLLAAQERCDEA